VPDLIVTSVTPNLGTGRGVRTYGVTAALARHRPVEVAYIVFDWDEPAPAFRALPSLSLRPLHASRGAARMLAYAQARLGRIPDGFARGVSPELARAARGAGSDVRVIADGPTVAAALLPLARHRPIVYLAHNLESGFRADGEVLRPFERTILRTFAETWMATRADEQAGRQLAGEEVHTRYVPNVIDLDLIDPVTPAGAERIAFVGDFTYAPNREGLAFLAEEVLPRVWERHPELRVSIVGRGPAEPPTDPRIEVLGFVEDLRAEYARADAVVVPLLHGGGSPLKFVEALAYALPVVATEHAGGLIEDARSGEHYLGAAGAEAFADALVGVLSDPARGRALGTAGRELVAARYSVAALAEWLAE
jgi:glycosyltransferase involved in cell wall biosynthesis